MLVVEDDPDARAALEQLLTDEGCQVATAGTAEDGLSQLKATQFHLVITDYRLPGQSGVWMLQEAAKAELLSNSRVLVMTAEPNLDAASDLKILRKPLDLDLFLREVFDALAAMQANELQPVGG